jgi:hypothetical protein
MAEPVRDESGEVKVVEPPALRVHPNRPDLQRANRPVIFHHRDTENTEKEPEIPGKKYKWDTDKHR